MGTKKDISAEKKSEIKALLDHSGFSQREIAKRCKVSQKMVSFVKNEKGGKRKNCKRKRNTSKYEDRIIIRTILKMRNHTIFHILQHLQSVYGILISRSTLQRRLRAAKIKSCKRSNKFMLNDRMVRKRRAFVWKMRSWGVRQWSRVSLNYKILKFYNLFIYYFFR